MFKSKTSDTVLSFGLAIVLIWFGIGELLSPADWTIFMPFFLANAPYAITLVIIHGAILLCLATLLVFNFGRKFAAGLVFLVISEIVITLIMNSGISDVAIRDIGLAIAALSLAFSGSEQDYVTRTTSSASPGIFPNTYTK